MIARDLMTTDLVTAYPDTTVVEAANYMLRFLVSGLPVVDSKGALVGMITAGDLMRRAELATELHLGGFGQFRAGNERLAADYSRAHGKLVRHAMTTALFTVSEDTPMQEIADIMGRHNIKRVLVTEGTKLLGLVSRTDLLRALVSTVRQRQETLCDDNEIKRRLFAIYTREPWAPLADIGISVKSGIVDLAGSVGTEAQRMALVAAAESIPGVKSVTDHLVRSKESPEQIQF